MNTFQELMRALLETFWTSYVQSKPVESVRKRFAVYHHRQILSNHMKENVQTPKEKPER